MLIPDLIDVGLPSILLQSGSDTKCHKPCLIPGSRGRHQRLVFPKSQKGNFFLPTKNVNNGY